MMSSSMRTTLFIISVTKLSWHKIVLDPCCMEDHLAAKIVSSERKHKECSLISLVKRIVFMYVLLVNPFQPIRKKCTKQAHLLIFMNLHSTVSLILAKLWLVQISELIMLSYHSVSSKTLFSYIYYLVCWRAKSLLQLFQGVSCECIVFYFAV